MVGAITTNTVLSKHANLQMRLDNQTSETTDMYTGLNESEQRRERRWACVKCEWCHRSDSRSKLPGDGA